MFCFLPLIMILMHLKYFRWRERIQTEEGGCGSRGQWRKETDKTRSRSKEGRKPQWLVLTGRVQNIGNVPIGGHTDVLDEIINRLANRCKHWQLFLSFGFFEKLQNGRSEKHLHWVDVFSFCSSCISVEGLVRRSRRFYSIQFHLMGNMTDSTIIISIINVQARSDVYIVKPFHSCQRSSLNLKWSNTTTSAAVTYCVLGPSASGRKSQHSLTQKSRN